MRHLVRKVTSSAAPGATLGHFGPRRPRSGPKLGAPPESSPRALARKGLPADARVKWFVFKRTCSQMLAQSKTLAGLPLGDPTGSVFVEFSDDSGSRAGGHFPTTGYFIQLGAISASSAPGC
jgi:hypothetical protein